MLFRQRPKEIKISCCIVVQQWICLAESIDGNAVSHTFGIELFGIGMLGEINLQCTIEKLFADAFGIGYPPEDAERKREVLKRCLKSVIEGWERCAMKLKNILIVVKDIEKSRQFYHDLFGLDQVLDNDGNLILTEGLVLQDERSGRNFWGGRFFQKTTPANCILRNVRSKHLRKNWKNWTGLRDVDSFWGR